jgi:branched-chain amino acid transport system substrate-binding protein
MSSIGILLPGSTLYPSIGIDFLQGIRSCFNYYRFSPIDFHVSPIGYGLKEGDIYIEAEKYLLSNNADAVVAYGGDQLVSRLSPLFTAAGKLLIITNTGANYPQLPPPGSPVLFHSLNDSLYSFLTGKLSVAEGDDNAIMATSFYDGGYQHAHAIANAFTIGGGNIKYNFVSHFKKEAFDTDGLADFLKTNPDVKKLLTVFCGDLARFFYEKIAPLQKEFDLQLFGSPMMFDSTPGDFAETKSYVKKIEGYTGWVPEIDNEANRAFKTYYQAANGKAANLFSLQGWETGLLLMAYLQQRETAANAVDAIEAFKDKSLSSPRGSIQVNKNNLILGPAYLVSASDQLEIKIENILENTSDALAEMIAQIPDTSSSSWRNTYLCI